MRAPASTWTSNSKFGLADFFGDVFLVWVEILGGRGSVCQGGRRSAVAMARPQAVSSARVLAVTSRSVTKLL